MVIVTTRRTFLKTTAATAGLGGMAAAQTGAVLAYVGTYSNPKGPEGAQGRGEGIYLFEMNPATGSLKQREVFRNQANPSWLAFDKTRTHLYSANEVSDYQGKSSGSVSVYRIDPSSARLTLMNTVSSEGAGPCHLSVHPSGRHVLVANYYGGTVAVLPVKSNGELGPASDVKTDHGTLGPAHAASAPPGSFAISGHDKPHAHMILPDPSGRFVIHADLGLDQLLIWRFDADKGKLTANDPPHVQLPPGDGPRHFTFHPNGRWFYSLQEEASTLVTFDYDAAKGALKSRQTISTLPKGFAGTDFTSEIAISKDARFVYAANRLHDTIAWFAVAPDGSLTLKGEAWTRGDYPRSFNFDPTGRFLYSCNQRADHIAVFRVDQQSGALTFTGEYVPVGTPAIILFLGA